MINKKDTMISHPLQCFDFQTFILDLYIKIKYMMLYDLSNFNELEYFVNYKLFH